MIVITKVEIHVGRLMEFWLDQCEMSTITKLKITEDVITEIDIFKILPKHRLLKCTYYILLENW